MLFIKFIITLLLLTDLSKAQIAFTAQYSKYNPLLNGGGITTGSMNYDWNVGGLKLTYSPNNAVEYYEFAHPIPSNGIVTQCVSPLVTGSPEVRQWSSLIDIPYTAPSSFPGQYSATSSPCATGASSNCTIGTRISAQPAAAPNTINYQLDRVDDSNPGLTACGCAVGTVTLDVPSCVSCSQITVNSACTILSKTCGTFVNSTYTGVGVQYQITFDLTNPACYGKFSVTMQNAYVGIGSVGLRGSKAGVTSDITCPNLAFTCTPPNTGITKYKDAKTGCGCQQDDIGDLVQWPLWLYPSYYTSAGVDSTVTFNSQQCTRYTKNAAAVGNVTELWLLSDQKTVCQFTTATGDIYTLNSFSQTTLGDAAPFQPPSGCNSCLKPIDLVILVELSDKTPFAAVAAIQNTIKRLASYFTINPPNTNIGIITYSSKGNSIDLPITSGVTSQYVINGANGGLVCCNAIGSNLQSPCCSAPATSLSNAISAAASQLKLQVSARPYASRNILLFSSGAFSDSDAQVVTALRNARTTVGDIVNLYSVALTQDPSVVTRLRYFKTQNDMINFPSLNSGAYIEKDKIINRVFVRPSYQTLATSIQQYVSSLCAGDGTRSCGRCCGDCTCGTICVAPTVCRTSKCFNVTLVPPPISTSSCCDYKQYVCPSSGANPCTFQQCDPFTDRCTTYSKQCPSNNACYNYVCNPTTGNCDAVQAFSNPDPCTIATCDTSSGVPKVKYTAVTCKAPDACSTSTCNKDTGNCDVAPKPQTLPNPCSIATCGSSGWTYSLNCPTGNDPCQKPYCTAGGVCSLQPKCGLSDLCTNRTCSNGVCSSGPACLTNPYMFGSENPNFCVTLNSCSTSTGCSYNTKTCTASSSTCQTSVCVPNTGNCNVTDICPPYKNGNLCMPRTTCDKSTDPVTCNYMDTVCTPPSSCQVSVCVPATGRCNTTDVCPYYQNNINKCLIRDVCNITGCYYKPAVTCTAPNSCTSNTCNPSTGKCVQEALCPSFDNSTIPAGNKCRPLNTTACVNKQCFFTNKVCNAPDTCTTSACEPTTGNCVNTAICPLKDQTVYPFGNNCSTRAACNVSGCHYTYKTCSSDITLCQNSSCDPKTGNCKTDYFCTQFENNNRCRTRLPCNSSMTCSYQDYVCPSNGNACQSATCDPAKGCVYADICPANQNVGGVTNLCMVRSSCNPLPCKYSPKSCPTGTACQNVTCEPSTGACGLIDICPKFETVNQNVNMCRPLSTCVGGSCTYQDKVCQAPNKCQMSTCNPIDGNCEISDVPNFNLATACGNDPTNGCQVPTLDKTLQSCCKFTPKCPPSQDLCSPSNCSNGNCFNTQIPCSSYEQLNGSPNLCRPGIGCNSTTGKCQYTSKNCPAPPLACQETTCEPATGECGYRNTSACIDKCVQNSVVCDQTLNCTIYTCDPKTAKCIPSNQTTCVPPNFCQVPSCDTSLDPQGFCKYSTFDVNLCPILYGPPDQCSYWGINPFNPRCCQLLPKCNQQIDPNFLCLLLSCDNTTGSATAGQCILRDNSDNLCPKNKVDPITGFADPCQPLIKCDNGTGGCIYDNLNVSCSNSRPLPCQLGYCSSSNGSCVYENTTACIPVSLCHDVTCQEDACQVFTCSEADGKCYLNRTTTCPPINNCTSQTCNPATGCVPVAFDLKRCPTPAACSVVVGNPNKTGCCDIAPLCTNTSADPLCDPIVCVNGKCIQQNLTDVCPPFQLDPATGVLDQCRLLNNCLSGVCGYADKPCPESVACFTPACNPRTGECSLVDNCPSNLCKQTKCNNVTGVCDVISETICSNDTCQNQTCDVNLGSCVVVNETTLADCPSIADKCVVRFLNGTKDGCCDTKPLCVTVDSCEPLTCDPQVGICQEVPACQPKKCSTPACSVVPVSQQASCIFTNVTCTNTNPCLTVPPCSEDGNSTNSPCKPVPIDCTPPNKCVSSLGCDPNNIIDGSPCVFQNKTCNDANLCTDDYCDPETGECVYEDLCDLGDSCFIYSCNISTGCIATPLKCEDNNACTNDTCFNGTCFYTPMKCDDDNNCTQNLCDPVLGCYFPTLTCNTTIEEARRNVCTSDPKEKDQNKIKKQKEACDALACSFPGCNSTTGCYIIPKACNLIAVSSTIILAAALSAGAIAGIVIAVIVGVVALGGGSAAVANHVSGGGLAITANNPLYKDNSLSGENPLHKQL